MTSSCSPVHAVIAERFPRPEFEAVQQMLAVPRRQTRPQRHDPYDLFCAVLAYLQPGMSWRTLPPGSPPWRTVHERYTTWTMRRPNGTLLESVLERAGLNAELAQLRARLRERGEASERRVPELPRRLSLQGC